MNSKLTIRCAIDDVSAFKNRCRRLLSLSAEERYNIIKDNILGSDAVVFFNMTGGFMKGGKESPCTEILKSSSAEYGSLSMEWSPKQVKTSETESVHEGPCYMLDLSTPEKKKLFLDNYRFYDHTDLTIELPELGTAFKVADDRDYEPYSFFFLSGTEIKMHIEHHTRQAYIF